LKQLLTDIDTDAESAFNRPTPKQDSCKDVYKPKVVHPDKLRILGVRGTKGRRGADLVPIAEAQEQRVGAGICIEAGFLQKAETGSTRYGIRYYSRAGLMPEHVSREQ
jgi:hypothetical protein